MWCRRHGLLCSNRPISFCYSFLINTSFNFVRCYSVTVWSRPQSLTPESRDLVIRSRVADRQALRLGSMVLRQFGAAERPEGAGGRPKSGRQIMCSRHQRLRSPSYRIEILLREPFRERGVHVSKPSKKQLLTFKPKAAKSRNEGKIQANFL